MAEKIAGLTIELTADDTKVVESFKTLNSNAKVFEDGLKEVNKQLKFDPSNIELLEEKQRLLAEATENTEQKLQKLKDAREIALKQLEDGEISPADFQRLETEILKTEGALDRYASQAENASQEIELVRQAQEQLGEEFDTSRTASAQLEEQMKKLAEEEANAKKEAEELNEKISGVAETAKNVSLAGLATIGATLAIGVTNANSLETALNTLQTQTGSTDGEMSALQDTLLAIYKNNYGEDYQDIATGIAQVQTNLNGISPEQLQATTEQAFLLRDVFGFEIPESTRAANQLMSEFGISSDEAFTLIAQGAQNGLNQNENLIDVISEYAPKFQGLGLDAEDMFNILTNGAKTGVFDIDKLGDAVKEFSLRIVDTGGTAGPVLESLGLDAQKLQKDFAEGGESGKQAFQTVIKALGEIEDPIQQNLAGVELFGTTWEDLGSTAILSLGNIEGEISKTQDTLDVLGNTQYDDFTATLTGIGRTLTAELVEPIQEELLPVLEEFSTGLSENKEGLQNIIDFITGLFTYILQNAETIIALIVGITTALGVFKTMQFIMGVVDSIKALQLANEGATVAQLALNAAQAANPIGLIIALIVGLVAALITAYQTSETFRDKVNGVFDAIKTALGVLIDFWIGVFEQLKTAFKDVGDFFDTVWNSIKDLSTSIWTSITDTFNKKMEEIKIILETVQIYFTTIFENIQLIVLALWDLISSYFSEKVEEINEKLTALKKYFETKFGEIKTFVTGIFDKIATYFSTKVETIKTTLSGLKDSFFDIFGKIKDFVFDIADKIANYFADKIKAIKDSLIGIANAIPGVNIQTSSARAQSARLSTTNNNYITITSSTQSTQDMRKLAKTIKEELVKL